MAPPQAPPLQLVQTLPPTRFNTPSFSLKKKLCMEGLWIIIDCTGCRKKKLSYTKMSILRFTTNTIRSFPRPAAGSPDAQFCKAQFFWMPCRKMMRIIKHAGEPSSLLPRHPGNSACTPGLNTSFSFTDLPDINGFWSTGFPQIIWASSDILSFLLQFEWKT